MVTMTIDRTRSNVSVKRATAGEIRLLVDVNHKADMRAKLKRTKERLCDVFRGMAVGDSVFLEGYTANCNDGDRRLKLLSMQGYSRNNSIVWGVRSTEEKGIKGVRVYRQA
jgi:hypothetical protein